MLAPGTAETVLAATEGGRLPNDWHMLYLGANHCVAPTQLAVPHAPAAPEPTPAPAPPSLGRCVASVALHAVVVHARAYEGLLALLAGATAPSDVLIMRRYQPHHPCYCLLERLAVQQPGHSDIIGRAVDYSSYLGRLPVSAELQPPPPPPPPPPLLPLEPATAAPSPTAAALGVPTEAGTAACV